MGENDYGIKVFRSDLPQSVKTRNLIFFFILSAIILVQCCYWFFANSVQPILLGMPFGMFFIVLFIFFEFLALLVLYLMESKDYED
jgi:amino acid transporter